jgi:RNA recognition motif-containing protein
MCSSAALPSLPLTSAHSWAFLDFADVSEATAALINPRNHKLNGRDLVLEYASLDAVRRGGQLPVKGSERPRKKPKTDKSMDSFQSESQPSGINNTRGQPQSNKAQAPQPERKPYERLGRDGKARPRPGAALAMAKRENVAIVESEGKKIKF